MKRKLLIILVLIVCLALIAWIFWNLYFYFQDRNRESEEEKKEKNIITEINTDEILKKDYEINADDEKPNEKLRLKIINYIEKNINNLTPYLSAHEKDWDIKRFSFLSNEITYVVFGDQDLLGRILVRCMENNTDLNCLRVSYFVPENYAWKLEEGENIFSYGKNQYYEKNGKGNWEKTYTSDEITFFPVSPSSLQGFQELVDYGKEEWRLDPLKTVQYEIYDILEFDLNDGKYELALQEEELAQVKVFYNKVEYLVYLYQPVKKGSEGIWVMEKMLKIK